MEISKLREQIILKFSPEWSLNDPAHREDHFETVFQCGLEINKQLDLGCDPKLILFAAYFHDMYARSRNNHHELSFYWMMATDHPLILENLSPSETLTVAWACNQHRASFKGTFKNPFSELINSADRGFPGDVPAMLERAIKYREANHPEMSRDEMVSGSIIHLKEKYGVGGYARYPDMYLKVFGGKLEKQLEEIHAL